VTETTEPAACPHSSVEALNRHTRGCAFAKADITVVAKALLDMERPAPPRPDPADPAALKVEKNALALVFIPAVMTLAQDWTEAHPETIFTMLQGQMGLMPAAELRAYVDPRNPQAFVCTQVYRSLNNLFQHLSAAYVGAVLQGAETGDAQMAWVASNLLERYEDALTAYHGHTSVAATHFTPNGHIMAGINTALFFILRALSALTVLGEEALGRPLTAGDLAQGAQNATPLLLTIARCHLEQLLALEGPLGKGEDLFLMRLDARAYRDTLARMFAVSAAADGLHLELAPTILAALPALASDRPRTGCPALYAATQDNVNAIVALVRMTQRAFASLAFG
jgi:hypothetical protein